METRAVPNRLITTYLEMTTPEQLRADYLDQPGIAVRPETYTDPAAYRELYSSVGETWNWRDRLIMPDGDLIAELA